MTNPLSLRRTLSVLALLAAFIGHASWALAGTSGNIRGVVSDASTGAPIAGAKVQIASPSQSITTTTDAHGQFTVFYLQPDDYTMTAEKAGYDSRSVSGYSVQADQTQVFDMQLSPSATSSR
ncbi:MAG: carboxypeptidase-like regulatory domain-containing protein [Candidatus Cybelea sp.]